jgi:hypothetical protein
VTKEQKRARKALNDTRRVILNSLRGEDEDPYHRRGKLLAKTPYDPPPLHELAQIFSGWVTTRPLNSIE